MAELDEETDLSNINGCLSSKHTRQLIEKQSRQLILTLPSQLKTPTLLNFQAVVDRKSYKVKTHGKTMLHAIADKTCDVQPKLALKVRFQKL